MDLGVQLKNDSKWGLNFSNFQFHGVSLTEASLLPREWFVMINSK